MRYLLLCAGMGRRLGAAGARLPKCLLPVGPETIASRLLRQIRAADAEADVQCVVGYRSDLLIPQLPGCTIVVNPFFDITGINASLWFARASFTDALWVLHADLILSDALARALFASPETDLVGYDSSVLDDKELNVRIDAGRVTRFGVNFSGYSGAYTGVLRLSRPAAAMFAEALDQRVRRGFNEPRTYYFFVMRRLIADLGAPLEGFDFAPFAWKEIDYPVDVAIARDWRDPPETRQPSPEDRL
jgi:choline kinase